MMIIWLLSTLSVVYCTDKCPTNLFGVGCRFQCHCHLDEQCDYFTGQCPSGCDINWAGPGCQYKNIAEHAGYTEHSDESANSKRAIDDDISTCTDTKNETSGTSKPWWRIYLPENHTISELEFITKDSFIEYFREFTVTVEYVPEELAKIERDSFILPKRSTCYEHKGKLSSRITNVVCNKPLTGNQIRIQLRQPGAKLVICDFRIFEGRNIAFGRRVSQSSQNLSRSAPTTVDGNTQIDKRNDCSDINAENSAWWSVDLAHVNVIDRILITPFKDVTRDHQLLASNDSLTWVSVSNGTTINQDGTGIKVDVIARFVKIVFGNGRTETIICQIQIFGDCLPDVCGFDCADVCHCENSNTHIKMSGNCSNGCQANWQGEGMKCDRAIFRTESSDVTIPVIIAASVSVASTLVIAGSVYFIVRALKRRDKSECCRICPGPFEGLTTRLSTYYNTKNIGLAKRKSKKNNKTEEDEGYTDLDSTAVKRGLKALKQSKF